MYLPSNRPDLSGPSTYSSICLSVWRLGSASSGCQLRRYSPTTRDDQQNNNSRKIQPLGQPVGWPSRKRELCALIRFQDRPAHIFNLPSPSPVHCSADNATVHSAKISQIIRSPIAIQHILIRRTNWPARPVRNQRNTFTTATLI